MNGSTKTQIGKWGHSLAVRIPKPLAEKSRLREGDALTISIGHEGAIVIKPARRKYALKELAAKITSRNRHDESDWGKAFGKEVW
jgi:antitoxin MazE